MNYSKIYIDVFGDDVWMKALKDRPELLMSLNEALEEAEGNSDSIKPLTHETVTKPTKTYQELGPNCAKTWPALDLGTV